MHDENDSNNGPDPPPHRRRSLKRFCFSRPERNFVGMTRDSTTVIASYVTLGPGMSRGGRLHERASVARCGCGGRPLTITPLNRERTVSVFVNLREGTVDDRFVCTFELRR